MLTLAFALLLCGAVAAASSISGALKLNADDVAFTTSPSFVSFNFDWWPNGTPAWTNSSVLIINLTNPLLVYLTSQLSPGHLRIVSRETRVNDQSYLLFESLFREALTKIGYLVFGKGFLL